MKVSKLLVAAAIATVAAASTSQAQVNCGGGGSEPAIGSASCSVTNEVSAAVPSVARLSINNTTTLLTAPKAADFGVGGNGALVQSAGPTLSVSSNVAHTLTASSNPSFTATAGGGTKPASDLQIQVGSTAFAAIGSAVMKSASATDVATYPLTFGTKYNWTVDTPATYSLVLTFTLTSP